MVNYFQTLIKIFYTIEINKAAVPELRLLKIILILFRPNRPFDDKNADFAKIKNRPVPNTNAFSIFLSLVYVDTENLSRNFSENMGIKKWQISRHMTDLLKNFQNKHWWKNNNHYIIEKFIKIYRLSAFKSDPLVNF